MASITVPYVVITDIPKTLTLWGQTQITEYANRLIFSHYIKLILLIPFRLFVLQFVLFHYNSLVSKGEVTRSYV